MSRGKGTFEVPRLQRAEHRRHDADLVRRFGDCHLSLSGHSRTTGRGSSSTAADSTSGRGYPATKIPEEPFVNVYHA